MGKYMRKAKVSGEVAIMDVAAAPLGVRTRARALALQRLQKQQAQGEEGAGGEYLELRSRRLEKLPPAAAAMRRCGGRKTAAAAAAAQEEAEASYGENMPELEAIERCVFSIFLARSWVSCSGFWGISGLLFRGIMSYQDFLVQKVEILALYVSI